MLEQDQTEKQALYQKYSDLLKDIGLENQLNRFHVNFLQEQKLDINQSMSNIDKLKSSEENDSIVQGKYIIEKEMKNFTFQIAQEIYFNRSIDLKEFFQWFQKKLKDD